MRYSIASLNSRSVIKWITVLFAGLFVLSLYFYYHSNGIYLNYKYGDLKSIKFVSGKIVQGESKEYKYFLSGSSVSVVSESYNTTTAIQDAKFQLDTLSGNSFSITSPLASINNVKADTVTLKKNAIIQFNGNKGPVGEVLIDNNSSVIYLYGLIDINGSDIKLQSKRGKWDMKRHILTLTGPTSITIYDKNNN